MAFVAGLSLRILTHERASSGHKNVLETVAVLVRREHLAGMTVTRAVEGYSLHGGMRTSNWADISDDLPLVIEVVDRTDRITQVLPEISALVTEGALTLADVRLYVPDTR